MGEYRFFFIGDGRRLVFVMGTCAFWVVIFFDFLGEFRNLFLYERF